MTIGGRVTISLNRISGPLFALSFVALVTVVGPANAGASHTAIQWYSWNPRVVDLATSDSATITVISSDPVAPEVAITTNGCAPSAVEREVIPLSLVAPSTYEATLTIDQLLTNYRAGDAHAVVGCLRIPGLQQSNLIANVRTSAMPDVPIQRLAPDAQASEHVVNLISDELLLGSHAPVSLLQRFYSYFGDDYDFIAVVEQVDSTHNRSFFKRRNNTLGIGLPVFDRLAGTGIPGGLQGTIIYPIDSFFDLAERATVHEIGHNWINYLNGSLADPRGAHWPISDVAYGIMGYSGQSSQGLAFPFNLVEQPDGSYLLSSREPASEFNDLELYSMGLVPESEVGSHFVFANQDQLGEITTGGILAGPTVAVTAADIIAANGPRVPAFGVARTDFRLATIVLSRDRLLTAEEMAFFDHMAARGESLVELPFTSGLARGFTKPFFLATGGRGTLSTTVLETTPVRTCNGLAATKVGTRGDDILWGTSGDDVIVGLGGNDKIYGKGGNDTLCGNGGRDRIFPGKGVDYIDGGSGSRDWVNYASAKRGVVVSLRTGVGRGQGRDTLMRIENISGSDFADRLIGDSRTNRIVGEAGADTVRGKGGDDFLWGSAGRDTLDGGAGSDVAKGGRGADTCAAEIQVSC